MKLIRKSLDILYWGGGVLGAISLIAILLLICAQMIARWTGGMFPGAANYAGYCMASATFFSLAYTLNYGAHIRVTIFLSNLGKYKRAIEIWCYGISAIFMSFFTWSAFERNIQSYKFNFISQGQDVTPLWIPEISMTLGAVLLTIAFFDHLVRLIFTDYMGIEQLTLEERTD